MKLIIHSLIATALLATVVAPAQAQQPTIGAVANAASNDTTQIARGSFMSIYGANLGAQAGPPSSLPLPTTLGATQVNIKPVNGSTTFKAFLHFVSSGQVNCILPSAVPAGPADVTVTVNNVTGPSRRIQVAESSFGIFTIGSQPAGLAVAQNFVSPTSVPLNLYTNPAGPGQTLIMYGTGLGAYTAGPDNAAPQAGNIVTNAKVMVAGYSITPLYSGRAPGLPGVDQINFTLPTTPPIPDGCSLLVQVQIGANVQTTAATIAKSSNDPVCHHPYALSTDQLSALQSGGTMKAAIALVERSHGIIAVANGQAFGTLTEKVAIQFRKFTANGSPIANQGYAFALSQAIGVCEVAQADPHGLDFIDFIDVNPAGSSPLDAGSTINLSGPGKSFDLAPGSLAKIVDGVDFPPVSTVQSALVDGNWMFSGAGGRDIGPFSAPFTLQNQFKLSFPTAITRGQPLTLAWSGGANSDADTVRIIMFGASLSGLNPTVICTAQAKAGTFTVPANLTSQLSNDAGAGALIAYSTVTSTRFTAPLVAGGALDSGAISVSVLEAYPTIPIH